MHARYTAFIVFASAMAATAHADPPLLLPEQYFAGDDARVTAIEEQDFSRVAAGGPGFLVVWQDQRPILTGQPNTAYEPLTGNQIDIYGMRLDPQGQPLDPGPIAICQLGRNQTKPQVAWNEAADQWLVVFSSERPDWYFFEDIVAVRVAANGTVLDTTPIMLRAENNDPANDGAFAANVSSDGTQWLAVWQDIKWQAGIGYPNIAGKRIAADGTVVDSTPVVLFQHNSYSFGPIQPQITWATDEWFLVWEHAGYDDIHGRRFDAALQPLDATPITVSTSGTYPRVASNGTDFMVVHRYNRAHRVTHAGAVLDPSGIAFLSPAGYDSRGPDVTWDGVNWVTVNSGSYTLPEIYVNKFTTGGVVVPPGAFVLRSTGGDQYTPTAASRSDGTVQVCWSGRNISQQVLENIQGAQLRADLSSGEFVEISAGLPRQSDVRIIDNGGVNVAVFTSRGGGTTRLLAQRMDAQGNPIDLEPVEVASVLEAYTLYGDVAWNGTSYLFAWANQGRVYGRRFDENLNPIDAGPVFFANDNASSPGVGSVGGNFYLAYAHTFSGDQRVLHGFLVDGSTMSLLTSPAQIGGGYVVWFPRVKEMGGRYFAVWQGQSNHDVSHSSTRGVLLNADGTVSVAQFIINASGADARDPDLVVAGDRALVTYADVDQGDAGRIAGRIVNADGTFRTGEFVIADAAGQQRFTACGFDGERFVAAWVDYRTLLPIEQMRGDIYGARVSLEGVVEDSDGGFEVTSGALPEDLPAVVGSGGKTIIAYSRLHGPTSTEVQRIGFATLGLNITDAADATVPTLDWTIGPNPFHERLWIELASPATNSGKALIEVVSAAGRRVARENLSAGQTAWQWNGRDGNGEAAPSGIYFVRLVENGSTRLSRSIAKLR